MTKNLKNGGEDVKAYLVTGGAGFIGSNFIIYMLKQYHNIKIINVDKLTYAGNLENLKDLQDDENYKFIKADICDREAITRIFEDYDIDYVVNFAAESHVDRSIDSPEIFVRTNVLGTQVLLNAAKESWETEDGFVDSKKFVQISTDEVYGSLEDKGFFTENTPLNPHSPYSASKAAADLIVKAYYDTYKMPVNITRCSNNYGPYQFPEKLIPLIINNCLNMRRIPVYGDGLNIRDWLHVEDHCRAIDQVINNGNIGEVYNIGGHNERTNIHVVKSIIDYLQENIDGTVTYDLIEYVNDRKGHDKRYAIDPTKIKNLLDWEPCILFEEGIEKTINWYIENKQWLDRVVSGEYSKYYSMMYENR